jgi:hypothetical protein
VTVRHDRWPGHDRDERQTVGLGPRAGRVNIHPACAV